MLAALRADETALAALAHALAREAPALAALGDAYAADAERTGDLLARHAAAPAPTARFAHLLDSEPTLVELIARAQAVCAQLRATLPKIASDRLHAALRAALARHESRLAELARD